MKRLILGTAGHIDHGKTALVRALTGEDTDRLPEEKRRGITIDLGFASLQLGELHFGVVDVPGHEAFIRNMLAGATGLDAVMLVVAADEGVMPQTREHLAILDLLDVRAGVVAVTKSDLVDDDWAQLVAQDIRDTLRGTSLAQAPVIGVSAKTGAGLDALRAAIIEQVARRQARSGADLFRMPIDRVFTVRGTGTVVTGTVWSGSVETGQQVRIGPADLSARIRGLEVHGSAVARASAGERAALALSGVEKAGLERGCTVTASDWPSARMLTLRLRMIADTEWALKTRQRVRVHVGTADVLARVVLLDADALVAGQGGWAQLRLEAPLVARVGDRIIMRSYSPVTTIAGGVVAEIAERKRTRIDAAGAATLSHILAPDPLESVTAFLIQRGAHGATAEELTVHTPHSPNAVEEALAGEEVLAIRSRVFARECVETMTTAVIATVDGIHAREPLQPWLERSEVRSAIRAGDAGLIEYALEVAIERGDLVVAGNRIKRTGFQAILSARQAELRSAILSALALAGLAAPSVDELGPADQVRPLLRLLELDGLVRAVAPTLYLDAEALTAAVDRTRLELGGRSGLSPAEFRSTLPVSRKHLIPILEYFDRQGITVRDGDLRRVAAASEAE
jgi:selenocysteine-specific elongation factor